MQRLSLVLILVLPGIYTAMSAGESITARGSVDSFQTSMPVTRKLQPNSLCTKDERIIYSCPVKRPARIVSLCASKDLTSDRGYLQYRFGLPGKIELEYPKDRTGTQQQFRYTHYFRAQFDLTEINFTINGYEYQIFDDYNGEEKPAVSSQGVSVTAPGKPKEVSFVCRSKPKADYTDLQAVLPGAGLISGGTYPRPGSFSRRCPSRVHAACPQGYLDQPFYGWGSTGGICESPLQRACMARL